MNKKTIKSVYHWSIMFLVMGAPLILSTISALPNTYGQTDRVEYQAKELVTPEQFLVGHTYRFFFPENHVEEIVGDVAPSITFGGFTDIQTNGTWSSTTTTYYRVYSSSNTGQISLYDGSRVCWSFSGSFVGTIISSIYGPADATFLRYAKEEIEVTKYAVANASYHVYDFLKGFVDLPINQWYKSLLSVTCGDYSQEYNAMEYVKAYPLYGLWVLIFDLAFDCLAFLPHIVHGITEKASGDKE